MLKPQLIPTLRAVVNSAACLAIQSHGHQLRAFTASAQRLNEASRPDKPLKPVKPEPKKLSSFEYHQQEIAKDEFEPKPLNRPLGLDNAPKAGDNSGIDTRSWRQRRDDFVDYDKHLVKRRALYVPAVTI
jgi:mitochondrial ATPase complex subunit ATP10